MSALFLLAMLFVALAMGVPVAISLGLASVSTMLLFADQSLLSTSQRFFHTMQVYPLLAVPFFILAASFMTTGGVAKRMIVFANALVGHFRGGLAMASLLACAFFAAVSGSAPATVVAVGSVMIAGMIRSGYSEKFAAGVICNAGTLGILIPPSIMLIVYSAIAELSPLRLYAAAMFPGLMLAGMYMIYVIGRATLNPSLAPKPREEDVPPLGEILLQVLTSFVPLALLIMSVLGAILMGLATPAEAAGVGAFGGLFLAACYRTLTWERLKEAVFLTAKTSAMVCWLFVGSWTFASVFSYLGGEKLIEHFVLSMDLSPTMFLILAQAIIFLLGWPLEWVPIVLIIIPILLPVIDKLGFNLTWFGILVAVNLQTAWLSPPVALSAYFLKGVVPEWDLKDIYGGMMQFMVIQLIGLILIISFPQIALWLPGYLYPGP